MVGDEVRETGRGQSCTWQTAWLLQTVESFLEQIQGVKRTDSWESKNLKNKSLLLGTELCPSNSYVKALTHNVDYIWREGF